MPDSTDALEVQLSAAWVAIGYMAKQANVDTKALSAFAAKALSSIPEPRKTAILQTLTRLVEAYEHVA